jgi:hypothetical protein
LNERSQPPPLLYGLGRPVSIPEVSIFETTWRTGA